jgi:hypothetical protein
MADSFVVKIDSRSVYAVLDDALNDTATQANLDDMAEQARSFMVSTVPVDTGNLQSVIEIRKTPEGQGRRIGVFEDNAKQVDYAVYVEAGWTTKNGKPVPAQPFSAPSINSVTG